MELSTGFIYNVISIRAILKEKNFTKKTNVILGFSIVGFLWIVILLSI